MERSSGVEPSDAADADDVVASCELDARGLGAVVVEMT
jgi:hypothetical protein